MAARFPPPFGSLRVPFGIAEPAAVSAAVAFVIGVAPRAGAAAVLIFAAPLFPSAFRRAGVTF